MFAPLRWAGLVLLTLLLAACGTPAAATDSSLSGSGIATTPTAPFDRPDPSTTPTPPAPATPPAASPTVPKGQRPPLPTPDPAAIAAGAPLRATLLAQIAEYDALCASGANCYDPAFWEARRELSSYNGWYNTFSFLCISDGKGGLYGPAVFRYFPPAELRTPAMLDLYVSGTPVCGMRGLQPSAAPSATPAPAR